MTLRKLVFVGVICAMQALGLPLAQAQEPDPRLVTRVYDAAQVVRIHGRVGVQATIAFADDEKIENVAVGDSEKWQITPNKRANLLFARPLDAAATTNMTVVTDKRTYLFDLVASAKDRPVYMLRFTYKDMAPAPPASALPAAGPPPVLAAAPQETPAPRPPAVDAAPFLPEPLTPPKPVLAEAAVPPPPSPPAPVAAEAPAPVPAPAVATLARSAVDEVVGAPAEVLPVGISALRAEADKPGDPAPAPLVRPKRVKRSKSTLAAIAEPAPQPQPLVPPAEAPAFVSVSAGVPYEPGALNFAWIRKGRSALLPLRAYDDGRSTYLVWGAKQTVPTVSVAGPGGEQPSPAITRRDRYVVISAVPSQILLSQGKSSATLDNLLLARRSLSLAGASAATGATE